MLCTHPSRTQTPDCRSSRLDLLLQRSGPHVGTDERAGSSAARFPNGVRDQGRNHETFEDVPRRTARTPGYGRMIDSSATHAFGPRERDSSATTPPAWRAISSRRTCSRCASTLLQPTSPSTVAPPAERALHPLLVPWLTSSLPRARRPAARHVAQQGAAPAGRHRRLCR